MSNFKRRPVEILVLGKVGVGKSSFINYILGLKEGDSGYCETGAGTRTTKRGIYRKEGTFDGIPFNLYDSMGLEASNQDEKQCWIDMIKYFFNPEGREKPICSSDKEGRNYQLDVPSRGFCHTIFYCLDSNVKIEDKDIDKEIIKMITKDFKQQVTIILTKADTPEKTAIDALEKALYKEFNKDDKDKVYIIKAVAFSEEIENSQGDVRKTRASGINQARAEILINFLNTLVVWLPKELIKDLRLAIHSEINSLSKIEKKLEDISNYIPSLKEEIENLNREFSGRIEDNYYDAMGQKENNENLAYGLQDEIKKLLNFVEVDGEEMNSLLVASDKKIKDAFTRESEKIDDNFRTLMKDWLEDLQSLITMFGIDNLESDAIALNLKEFKGMVITKTGNNGFSLQTSVDTMNDAMRWTNAILGTGGIIATLIAIPEPITTIIGIGLGVLNIFFQAFKGPDKKELKKIKDDLIQQARGYVNDLDENIKAKLETFNTYIKNVEEEYDKTEKEIIKVLKKELGKMIVDKKKIRKDARLQDGFKELKE